MTMRAYLKDSRIELVRPVSTWNTCVTRCNDTLSVINECGFRDNCFFSRSRTELVTEGEECASGEKLQGDAARTRKSSLRGKERETETLRNLLANVTAVR